MGIHSALPKICQHHEDVPHYPTLDDSAKTISSYSAYTFRRSGGRRAGAPPTPSEDLIRLANCCSDFDPNVPYDVCYEFPSFAAYGLKQRLWQICHGSVDKRLKAQIRREMPVDQDANVWLFTAYQAS
ncbi:hypothetical protein AAFF_G00121640 [Aldrovandia affinis]|uniref:Uncharacterized protein n=1 Tax=Aldrovandia affinis TaxID=143900 RepID=A0AAD7RRY3_9TELE|nr:hypothetical protein AAFF_G00121640 [Aldrovandia affinis]